MRLLHESADGTRTLATDVETADSFLAQMKGLMGRSSVPADYALVFPVRTDPVEAALDRVPPFDRVVDPETYGVHMLFVRTPLDAIWIEDGEVVQVRTLPPWTGRGSARADTLVEMAGGAADGVRVGDGVRLVDGVDSGAENRNDGVS